MNLAIGIGALIGLVVLGYVGAIFVVQVRQEWKRQMALREKGNRRT